MHDIEELTTVPAPKVYRFPKTDDDIGTEKPTRGVKRAKAKYADDHDIEFDEVAARKLGYENGIHLHVVVAPVSSDATTGELTAADHTRQAYQHITQARRKFGPVEYDAETDSILTDLQNLLSELSINLEVMDEEVTRADRPPRRHIVRDLLNGDRDAIADADDVGTRDPFDVEAIHKARDGSITLRFDYYTAYEGTEAGQVIEFDIMEVDTDE
jgi:hypothetical protein